MRHPPGKRHIALTIAAAALLAVLWAAWPGAAEEARASSAPDVPPLSGRVNDYADMLSNGTRRALEAKLAAFETSDSTQVVVLTIPSLGGADLEEYSVRVAQAWGIGRKGRDNGVLLLVAKADRAIRIEVGYGLEGRLTDLLAGRIVDLEMRPLFKEGRYDEGMVKGVDAIIAAVRGEYKGTERAPGQGKGDDGAGVLPALVVLFIFGALFRNLPAVLRGIAGAVLLPAIGLYFSFGLLLVILLIPVGAFLGVVLPFIFGGPFFGGGGFGGGWGGGGGSGGGNDDFRGGGGGFGGGGASGRW